MRPLIRLATFGQAPPRREGEIDASQVCVCPRGLVLIVSGCAKDNDTRQQHPRRTPRPLRPSPNRSNPPWSRQRPRRSLALQRPPRAPAAGTMATPNAFALPCQNDQSCGFAKCNVQFGKCAFPCVSAVDCAAGATCNAVTGLCLPGAPRNKS